MKIFVPNNVDLSRNAKKQIAMIEKNGHYDKFVNTINEYFRFISSKFHDINEAIRRGWRIEKLKSGRGESVFSIRISQSDRFTYSIDNGHVTVLGLLGHYVGTDFAYSIKYEELENVASSIYNDDSLYDEVVDSIEGIEVIPTYDNNTINKLEFIYGDEHYFFYREDIKELSKNEKEINDIDMLDDQTLLNIITDEYINSIEDNYNDDNEDKNLEEKETSKNNQYFLKQNFISNNSLISKLLESNDYATYNMGVFLAIIEKQFPEYLEETLEILKNNISFDNNEVIYISYGFDEFTLKSSTTLLRYLLSSNDTVFMGKRFLKNIINGEEDRDFEFYAYSSYLRKRAKDANQSGLEDLVKALCDAYEKNTSKEETLDNMRKLFFLVENNGLIIVKSNDDAYYDPRFNMINLNKHYNSGKVMFHEFGHAVDDNLIRRDRSNKPEALLQKARQNIMNNPRSLELINKLNDKLINVRAFASSAYNGALIRKYGSIEGAIDAFQELVERKIESGKIKKLLKKHGVDSDLIIDLLYDLEDGKITTRDIAIELYKCDVSLHCSKFAYLKEEGTLIGLISSIFEGMEAVINGENVRFQLGHSKEYFESCPDNCMSELLADLNELILSGNQEFIDTFIDLVGVEVWDQLMEIRNTGRIINSKNNQRKKAA